MIWRLYRSICVSSNTHASFDDVLLYRLDGDAAVAEPGDRAIDLFAGAVELERDQSHGIRDVGSAYVGDERKLASELVDDRLFDQVRRIGEVDLLTDLRLRRSLA